MHPAILWLEVPQTALLSLSKKAAAMHYMDARQMAHPDYVWRD